MKVFHIEEVDLTRDQVNSYINQMVSAMPVPGCTDELACNYDSEAIFNDGSCQYPEDFGWCDCEGTIEDCAGECGGSAILVTLCEDTDGDGLGNPGTETEECVNSGRDITDGCELPENNLYLFEY